MTKYRLNFAKPTVVKTNIRTFSFTVTTHTHHFTYRMFCWGLLLEGGTHDNGWNNCPALPFVRILALVQCLCGESFGLLLELCNFTVHIFWISSIGFLGQIINPLDDDALGIKFKRAVFKKFAAVMMTSRRQLTTASLSALWMNVCTTPRNGASYSSVDEHVITPILSRTWLCSLVHEQIHERITLCACAEQICNYSSNYWFGVECSTNGLSNESWIRNNRD